MRVPIHQRLVLILKLKKHRRIDPDIDTQSVFLKVFKDVPRMDRDMLLPGARAHMSRLDRALIAYPLAGGVVLLLYNIGHSIWPALLTGAGTAVLAAAGAKMVTW